MISKNKIQLIHSLDRKKERQKLNLFVAEGQKLVGELLATQLPEYVACCETWYQDHRSQLPSNLPVDLVTHDELRRASLLQHPQEVLALFRIATDKTSLAQAAATDLVLALDGVQDPGNLGTIVRIADWFGIRHIYCSTDTADIYNPKAVQATMGALARVALHYCELADELRNCHVPIYGTHLDGQNLYAQELSSTGIIVMGNEGRGISPQIGHLVTHRLFIPPYPADSATVESLNVAIATAITCAEFRRRM